MATMHSGCLCYNYSEISDSDYEEYLSNIENVKKKYERYKSDNEEFDYYSDSDEESWICGLVDECPFLSNIRDMYSGNESGYPDWTPITFELICVWVVTFILVPGPWSHRRVKLLPLLLIYLCGIYGFICIIDLLFNIIGRPTNIRQKIYSFIVNLYANIVNAVVTFFQAIMHCIRVLLSIIKTCVILFCLDIKLLCIQKTKELLCSIQFVHKVMYTRNKWIIRLLYLNCVMVLILLISNIIFAIHG
eukprot:152880_1